MKILLLLRKALCFCFFLSLVLALQGGCITIQDKKNRNNQIKNASKTFVEAYMAERVLESKESTRELYFEIYQLQDSIQQALRDVKTVEGLKAASIQAEAREVENLESNLHRYVDYAGSDDYTHQFGLLLESSDVAKSADQLFRMIYPIPPGNQLPADLKELKVLAKARNTFLFNLQEYLNKRALTASQAYRNWAALYRQKGMELHEAVLEDKRFSMTDLERIETERLAEKYLALSLEFTEKNDSLLAAAKESPNPWKAGAERKMKQHLRLQNLAQ